MVEIIAVGPAECPNCTIRELREQADQQNQASEGEAVMSVKSSLTLKMTGHNSQQPKVHFTIANPPLGPCRASHAGSEGGQVTSQDATCLHASIVSLLLPGSTSHRQGLDQGPLSCLYPGSLMVHAPVWFRVPLGIVDKNFLCAYRSI